MVIADKVPSQQLAIALRAAHDLNKFHKIDAEILQSSEIMQRAQADNLGPGNIVVIGKQDSVFNRWCFSHQESAFDLESDPVALNRKKLGGNSLGEHFRQNGLGPI